jgi:hypothetical protein
VRRNAAAYLPDEYALCSVVVMLFAVTNFVRAADAQGFRHSYKISLITVATANRQTQNEHFGKIRYPKL